MANTTFKKAKKQSAAKPPKLVQLKAKYTGRVARKPVAPKGAEPKLPKDTQTRFERGEMALLKKKKTL